MIFEELQCEDIPQEYIPNEQDLMDMEVAFAFDPTIEEKLEVLKKELDEVF